MNAKFPGLNYQIAPVEGFGIERFVAEAKDKKSTWDVYVGQTPFVEMSAFIKAGVIEPWDDYIPKDVLDDIIPSIREECTVDGKLYSWPFLLDVTGSAWHSGITAKAGLPDAAPATWDDVLENAKKIVDTKAAPWGATFDAPRCRVERKGGLLPGRIQQAGGEFEAFRFRPRASQQDLRRRFSNVGIGPGRTSCTSCQPR